MKKYFFIPFCIFLFAFNVTGVQAQNPILWGMSGGGQGNVGNIFQTNATGSTFKSDFSFYIQGDYPYGDVIQASNGLLYGMTSQSGANGGGIIFSYNISTGMETDIYDFGSGTDGYGPNGALIQASNGLLYGMTYWGGTKGDGIIFRYNISTGIETDLHDFGSGSDGYTPNGSLVQANNGLLYGMTSSGGINGDDGIIFSYNITTGVETKIHDFGTGTDGSAPNGSLIQAGNGLFYGMTTYGGTNYSGTIFSYNVSTGIETDLHDFGNGTDGAVPQGSFIQDGSGLFYGTTSFGGSKGRGTIFSYNSSTGLESNLYNFTGGTTDGDYPSGSVLLVNNGLLYGMDIAGGVNDGGIIFSYDISSSKENDLYDFGRSPDGYGTGSALILAKDGLLYGMTNAGGIYGSGTIFSYNNSTGAVTDLHDFGNDTDGREPLGSLIQASNGLLYGMTYTGGPYGRGTIFSYNISTGIETELHYFDSTEGYNPEGSLIQASNGLLYGLTIYGGSNGFYGGTIFSYDIPKGMETVLHNFGIGTDGYTPYGSLIQANDGLLYGMTSSGGTNDTANYGDGVIFSYNISTDTEIVIDDFGSNNDDGLNPFASLIQANNGLLYGMTYEGGDDGYGNIFSYNISTGTETNLYSFYFGKDGFLPGGSLIQASNNLLYGTTSHGGVNYDGTIFSYDISTGIETDIHDFTGIDGDNPNGDLLEDDSTTSIDQLPININQLLIYPNPSSNFVHISQTLQQEQSVQLSLYNMLGQQLWKTDLGNVNSIDATVPVTNIASGVYILKVNTGGVFQQKEVVVVR